MLDGIEVFFRGFYLSGVFHRILCHVNLVSGISANAILGPCIIVPDDSVVGISKKVTIIHFEHVSTFVFGGFGKICVQHRFIFPGPVQGEHVCAQMLVSLIIHQLRLKIGHSASDLHINIWRETIPVHVHVQRIHWGCCFPTKRGDGAPGPVNTVFQKGFKKRDPLLHGCHTVHITSGILSPTFLMIEHVFISYHACDCGQIVIQIGQEYSLKVGVF